MRITGGCFKSRKLNTPKGLTTRPTSEKLRQTFFDIVQHQIENTTFLDLFAGSGAMGIEALSRGASHTTFIEKNKKALDCIHQNLSSLELSNEAKVLAGDTLFLLKKLEKEKKQFNLIYADPPYSRDFDHLILLFFDQSSLLSKEGMLFIEERFISKKELPPLQSLVMTKERKMGSSILLQFSHRNQEIFSGGVEK